MLFKSNWSLILTTKPRSPNYVLAYWAGGRRRERTARERLWSRHRHAASQIGLLLADSESNSACI